MTNNLKEQINNDLCNINLSEKIIKNIKCGRKTKKVGISTYIVPIVSFFILSVTCVYAATQIYSITVNGKQIPDLDNMAIIRIKDIENYNLNKAGNITKKYNNMNELEKDIGVSILSCKYAENNEYQLINYEKIGYGYNSIKVGAYIVGDLTNIKYVEENKYYSWTAGRKYRTPINLQIEIISDSRQQFFDTEYLGVYSYYDTITSDKGYTVNLLRSAGKVCAIFVADGIRYTLDGNVDIDTMIDIINSMEYQN